MTTHTDDDIEEHDLGLSHDLPKLMERNTFGRRGLLGLLGGVGIAAVAGCAADGTTTTTTSTATPEDGPPSGGGGMPGEGSGVEVAEGEIPEETAGPYPGDGSNGPNVLSESGVVRSDLTTSVGSAGGTAGGIPTSVRLRVYDLAGADITPLAGAAVYLWHCDREGRYSMYDGGVEDENYCRGVQETDADGWLEFTTVFPGCYAGRWPHMHFEVYESLEAATTYSNKMRTSQLALPRDACETVYATAGYESSVENLARLSIDTDNVFADGYSLQMASAEGSAEEGYTVTLNVPV